MFLALYSAYTETPVPNTLALTGEIGLHGQILPVGGVEDKGVEDKLEAARRGGDALGGHGISGGTGDRITNRRNGANA